MPLSGVTPRGPAAKVGLRAGDVIVALAGHLVKSQGDLMTVLGGLTVGKAVPIVVLRGEERIEAEIVPARRGRR